MCQCWWSAPAIIAAQHAAAIHAEPRLHLAGVVDVDPGRAAAASRFNGGVPAFTDLAEALEETGAGGCVVCTPNDTHAGIAVQIAEAGAHLLIEKPLATEVAGARRAVEASASPRARAVRRFRRNRLAVAGSVVLGAVVLMSLLAPLIAGHPNAVDLDAVQQGPSGAHWLGTDTSGRDVFARTLHAGRVSLLVGLAAALGAVVVGTLFGAVAGLFGGVVDNAIMRTADIVMSFPTVVVILVLAGIVGPSVPVLIIAIGATQWPVAGRVVRGVTLSRSADAASPASPPTPEPTRRGNVDDDRPAAANYHANALARGLALLERLAAQTGTLTLNDFSTGTGLPKSTLVRLLGVLEEMGYVVRADERPAYRLGHKTLMLSTAYLSGLDLSQVAGEHLARVAEATGQTANLGVLDGHEVLHVCVREPDRPIRFHTTPGTRDAVYCTGLGKMLLARLDPPEAARHLPPEPFPSRTEHTLTTARALGEELRVTAERGYALDDNEGSVGLRCVAAPVEVDGDCVAAVSVSGPSAEFDDDRRAGYLERLRAAAADLAADADVVAALEYLRSSLRSGAPHPREDH